MKLPALFTCSAALVSSTVRVFPLFSLIITDLSIKNIRSFDQIIRLFVIHNKVSL